jgi:hypothetical protein
MIVAGHLAHRDPDLAVVDLAPVPAPLALDPDRVRAALREAAGIKGDDAIGFAQLLDHLPDQPGDQWPMIPGSDANEVLDDLSLDIDSGGDFLGILAVHVGQQPLEGEVDMAPAGLGLESALVWHDKIAQAVHHQVEHVRGNDAVVSL